MVKRQAIRDVNPYEHKSFNLPKCNITYQVIQIDVA